MIGLIIVKISLININSLSHYNNILNNETNIFYIDIRLINHHINTLQLNSLNVVNRINI